MTSYLATPVLDDVDVDGIVQEISLPSPRHGDQSSESTPHMPCSLGAQTTLDCSAQIRWLCDRDAALTRIVEDLSQQVRSLEASLDSRLRHVVASLEEETESRECTIADLKGGIVKRIQAEVSEQVAAASAEIHQSARSTILTPELLRPFAQDQTRVDDVQETDSFDSERDMDDVLDASSVPARPRETLVRQASLKAVSALQLGLLTECASQPPLTSPVGQAHARQRARISGTTANVAYNSVVGPVLGYSCGEIAVGGSARRGDGRHPGLTRLPLALSCGPHCNGSWVLPAADRFEGFLEAQVQEAHAVQEAQGGALEQAKAAGHEDVSPLDTDVAGFEIACLAVALEEKASFEKLPSKHSSGFMLIDCL